MGAARRGRSQPPLREFELIAQIQRRVRDTQRSVICGIGDDAAVLRSSASEDLLITTDLMAEGVHFERRTTEWRSLGYRATAANLSDIAAMGGTPRHVLVSLALPGSCRAHDIDRLYRGIGDAGANWHLQVIGGDTSASRQGIFVSLTVIGTVPRGRALLRAGARVDDWLYVTGTLGDALGGLSLLTMPKARGASRLGEAHRAVLINRHLHPTPRVAFGQALSARGLATAAIDLSDGLAGDVRHLCRESDIGVEIDGTALPLSPALQAYARCMGQDPLALALTGGEDYELLFTVPPSRVGALHRTARRIGCPITCIGRAQPKRAGLRLKTAEGVRPLPRLSYEHFDPHPSVSHPAC